MKLYTLLITGLCLVTITIACGKKPAAKCTENLLETYNSALNTDSSLNDQARAEAEANFRKKVGSANCDATRAGKTVNLSAKSLERDLSEVRKLQGVNADTSQIKAENKTADDKSKETVDATKATDDKTQADQKTIDQTQKIDDSSKTTEAKSDEPTIIIDDKAIALDAANKAAASAAADVKEESKTDAKATDIDEAVTTDDKATEKKVEDDKTVRVEEVLEPVTKSLSLSCAASDEKRNVLKLSKDLTAVKTEKLGNAKIFNENNKIILQVSPQSSLTFDTQTKQTIFSSNETAGSQILLLCENADTSSCQATGQSNLKQKITDKDLQVGLLVPTKEIMLRIKKENGIVALHLVNKIALTDSLFQINIAKNLVTVVQTVQKPQLKTNAISCQLR
jgi:hypothetical protein